MLRVMVQVKYGHIQQKEARVMLAASRPCVRAKGSRTESGALDVS